MNSGSATFKRQAVNSHVNLWTFAVVFALTMVAGWVLTSLSVDETGFSHLYLLALLQFAPFAICVTRGHFNYISFILLNHLVCYSLGKFNNVMNVTGIKRFYPETILAIKEQITCVMLIISVYYICRYLFFFRFTEREKYQLISLKPFPYIFLLAYVFLFPVATQYLPAAWLAIHFISVNADLVMLLTSHCPQMPRLATYAKIGSFLMCFIYFLKLGSLGMMLNYLGLAFISACLKREHLQILFVAGVLCIGLVVQAVKQDFRLVIYANPTLGLAERSAVLGELISTSPELFKEEEEDEKQLEAEDEVAVRPEEGGGLGKTLLRSFDRINDDSLERVLTMTPSRVPYWNGESYASIPFMFIPRPLWPEKPTRHFWNKFGREYGYLLSDDNVTSVAVSFLAEGYMNYGHAGMYGSAVFFGFLVSAVERVGYYIAGGYFFFSFIVFLMPLLHYSSDMGSMVHALVIFAVVMLVLRPQIQKVARKDEYS